MLPLARFTVQQRGGRTPPLNVARLGRTTVKALTCLLKFTQGSDGLLHHKLQLDTVRDFASSGMLGGHVLFQFQHLVFPMCNLMPANANFSPNKFLHTASPTWRCQRVDVIEKCEQLFTNLHLCFGNNQGIMNCQTRQERHEGISLFSSLRLPDFVPFTLVVDPQTS